MTISVGHGKGKTSQLQTSPSSHVFCFTGYKLRKTDPESSSYLRYRGETFSLTAIVFVRHFEKEMPLTIYHGPEISTISGNE